ncbi:AarF/UbiB family protein [uncultured Microbacterium sp.]|uniref:ABC1 kinase family protein n=1 Tax=uncultured Microbacterium sp. TaxID=191216 RepID=UPI0028D72E0C|nr:AarF/UbiB family protein [uncultured Microbacterium sp.]
MPNWLLFALVALAFAAIATWVSRRLLDTPVGWLRSLVFSVVVFSLSIPLVLWMLEQSNVYEDGQFLVAWPIAGTIVALILGWVFAVVVVVIVVSEFLVPTRPLRNPIVVIRNAIRRRDRARRYAQIVVIASRHGIGLYQNRANGYTDELPEALVGALNEAGVTFVKLGQVLSSREDVLPPQLVKALSTLQMDSTPIPWSEAEAAIRHELQRPLDEVFASVDQTPLAAASVAQVHAAVLKDGERVVIKIQRPRARAQVTTDLDILERLAADAERRTEWARDYGARALAAEFARTLREELDYRVEAANTEMIRGAIERSHAPALNVPTVHHDVTTSRMLVIERADGIPFSRLTPDALPPAQAEAVVNGVVDAVFEQIAVRGVFHADLHAGNLILAEDGTVTLIDFGAIGILERSVRRLLAPLLVAIANDDDVSATDIVLLLCAPMSGGSVEQAVLQRDIGAILTRVANAQVGENVFTALIDVLRRHRLAMPPSLLLVFRTLISLEGSLRRLVPGYDMVGRGLSRAPLIALQLASPKMIALGLQAQSAIVSEQLRRLPRRIEGITQALQDGTFQVRVRALESADDRRWLDSILGEVTATVVGVALVATGFFLAVSDVGPQITDGVRAFSFLGSVLGLGGMLLLLRSLSGAFRRREPES